MEASVFHWYKAKLTFQFEARRFGLKEHLFFVVIWQVATYTAFNQVVQEGGIIATKYETNIVIKEMSANL